MIAMSSFASWFRKKIKRKITGTVFLLTVIVIFSTGISAYLLLRSLIFTQMNESLKHGMFHVSEDVVKRIETISSNLYETANNTLIGNALVDDRGREIYLKNFLKSLSYISDIKIIAIMTDFEGKPIADNSPYDSKLVDSKWLEKNIEKGKHNATISGDPDNPYLVVVEPVLFANTGLPEGSLVYLINLNNLLLSDWFEHYRETLIWMSSVQFEVIDTASNRNGIVGKTGKTENEMSIIKDVELKGAFDSIALQIEILVDRKILYHPLDVLLIISSILGVIILLFSIVLSLIVGNQLSFRIAQLQNWVTDTVTRKSVDQRFTITGEDEVARLGEAFNETLDRLDKAFKALELNSRMQLDLSEERYRDLVESTLQGIVVHRDHIPLFVNKTFAKIYGYDSTEEIMKVNLLEQLVAPEERERIVEYRNSRMHNGAAPMQYQFRGVKKDGSLIWLDSTHKVIQWDGEAAILSTQIDITERMHAEELIRLQDQQLVQADKMASLGILVSGVAHEINNPNNFIMFNIPILSKIWDDALPILAQHQKETEGFKLGDMPFEKVAEAVPKLLSGAASGAERIKNIVANLKNFAQKDASEDFQPVDINEVLMSTMMLLSSDIQKRTRKFSMDCAKDIPPFLGNYQKMEQVAVNLITNACQALTDMENAVRVSTEYDDQEKKIRLIVADEGKGISPENLQKVMNPFFTTKRDSGGTGLGLSVSYSIVEEHHGYMEFSSIEGKGTTAIVSLPVAGSG